MVMRVTGKNLDLGDVLRAEAERRVNEVVAKYLDDGYNGHVTVSKDGTLFHTECTVKSDHAPSMTAHGEAYDAYMSLDKAILHLGQQVRRFKRKRDKAAVHSDHMKTIDQMAMPDGLDDDEHDILHQNAGGSAIIAEAVTNAPSHSVMTATAAFEAQNKSVLVFRNSGTKRINVLYRRPDGHYGWVDIA